MTAGELIALLKEHPEDRRVVVQGYEGGYDDLAPHQVVTLRLVLELNAGRDDDRCGPHDEVAFIRERLPEGAEVVEAVALHRTSS